MRHWPWPVARFLVADDSMRPTLEPGDRLVLLTRPWCGPFAPGHVVVLHDPHHPTRLLAKRVHATLPPEPGSPNPRYDVRGDAADRSRDSRAFGPVPGSALLGRVVWRYLPPGRRGRL